MAVFNGAAIIDGSLDSLQQQRFDEFELLVVDDGSTDGSAERIEAKGDPRFRVLRQSHSGLTPALNRGLGGLKGKYVARLDCGDRCHPERFLRQVAFLDRHPDRLLTGCRIRRLDRQGVELGVSELVTDPREIRRGLLRINLFQHSSIMARCEALKAVGGYRPFFRYSQDLDLYLRLSELGPLGNLDEVLSDWVIDPGSISFRQRKNQAAYAEIARHCARRRSLGRPDPVDTGEVEAPSFPELDQDQRMRCYHFEVARAALMGGKGGRARKELSSCLRCGGSPLQVAVLYAFSLLPRRMQQGLRSLRVRKLVREEG